MIEIKNITKVYQTGSIATNALGKITLTIRKGEYVLLTGRSGSGKSTLLNILTGVDKPSDGEVFIETKRITSLSEDELSMWRGTKIGIIFQFFQLIPTLSVLENIILPMDLVNIVPEKDREIKGMEILTLVGMEKHRDKMPSSLSGGEQQRVAIARALANNAPIIFADEPTGNLDSSNADNVFALLEKLNKKGKTIIMVTHEKGCIQGATRKIVLNDGIVIEDVKLGGEANYVSSFI